MTRHFTKTSRMVSITMLRPGSKNITVDREIFEDETGREFVRMNCNWRSLERFTDDDTFRVYRY